MQSALSPEMVKKINAIYQWDITVKGKKAATWTVDLKNGSGKIYEGAAKPKAGCTITVDDDDFVGLVNGSLDSMKAFMTGKIKVKGNVMLATKLETLFEGGAPKAKL